MDFTNFSLIREVYGPERTYRNAIMTKHPMKGVFSLVMFSEKEPGRLNYYKKQNLLYS